MSVNVKAVKTKNPRKGSFRGSGISVLLEAAKHKVFQNNYPERLVGMMMVLGVAQDVHKGGKPESLKWSGLTLASRHGFANPKTKDFQGRRRSAR
ncbi:hypothetical protein [Zobellella taiwanensis]